MPRINKISRYCKSDKNRKIKNETEKHHFSEYQGSIKLITLLILFQSLFKPCNCFRIEVMFPNEEGKRQSIRKDNTPYVLQTIGENQLIPSTSNQAFSNTTKNTNYIQEVNIVDIDQEFDKSKQTEHTAKRKFDDNIIPSGSCLSAEIHSDFDDSQPLDLSCKKKIKSSQIIEDKDSEWLKKSNTSISFDYSDKFIIQSRYFNNFRESKPDDHKFNISEITSTNIDIQTFEILLYVLHFGYHKKCLDLKTKNFINFLEAFTYLSCYTNSSVMYTLYKNLTPLLVSYMNYVKLKLPDETVKNTLFKNSMLFLPFLSTIFRTVDVKFDKNTDELLFSKKSNQFEIFFFDTKTIQKLIIRATFDALILITNEPNIDTKLFSELIHLYIINTVKISHDNIYYSEAYENDKNYISKKLPREEVHSNLNIFSFDVLKDIFLTTKYDTKFLELERIALSFYDLNLFTSFRNLESLSLVNCIWPTNIHFFSKLYFNFPRLRILKLVGFKLNEVFFKNLIKIKIEYLDLIDCYYKCCNDKLIIWDDDNTLRGLRIDYSKLGNECTNFLIKSKNLEYISLRHIKFPCNKSGSFLLGRKNFTSLELSGFNILEYISNFFYVDIEVENLSLTDMSSIELKCILKQKTLHTSTKSLDLSGCPLDSVEIDFLKQFEKLEALKLCNLPSLEQSLTGIDFSFTNTLLSIDLSNSKFFQNDLMFLCQFNCLKELKIANCDFKPGFMRFIEFGFSCSSLQKLDISENQLDIHDIYSLSLLKNLNYLSITLDDRIYMQFVARYGNISFSKLSTLVLLSTSTTKIPIKFITAQLSLINLHFINLTINDGILSVEDISCLKYLKNIKFS
ncbi:hypothetical protein CWI38_0425p0020 [Hamiltosporidium tvaerminnensis]|uniref:Leucine-rich repeat-containing protein n=1 Tax=Hamiltosporidium tvaerminnensis TaxID=1176355 RepID=A0A4Q9LZU5_9MICR|nr:hypothetical protein CWI38_0425p0020 [Hamiltosporidium tvaerminnensis]